METIRVERSVMVKKDVDVFVAGGGPAGVAAAVTAARLGARVFLTERGQCFGGAAALTLVPAFMRFSDGENFVSGGIGREIFDVLYGKDTSYTEKEYSIDIEALKRIYDNMMEESGADFLFSSEVIGIECSADGAIEYAVVKGKGVYRHDGRRHARGVERCAIRKRRRRRSHDARHTVYHLEQH